VYANIHGKGEAWGGFSRDDGAYRIDNVPAGTYTLKCALIGYQSHEVERVKVKAGQVVTVDFRLKDGPPQTLSSVEVWAYPREGSSGKDGAASGSSAILAVPEASAQPVRRTYGLLPQKAGVVADGSALHFRGGRSGEASYQVNGVPVVPYTGGNALPNDEPYDAMFFQHYGVNPLIPADEDSLSTFAVDVDNAAYTVARRYIELGNLPPDESVRVEEFVNFFPQGYPRFEQPDFRIFTEGAPAPFADGYTLLRVGIKAREIDPRDRKPATLTFVIDVSGSMAREDRLELVKRALYLLVGQLRRGDEVGIVVYGSRGHVLLDPVRIDDDLAYDPDDDRMQPAAFENEDLWPRQRGARGRVLGAIDRLAPEGSTNAEEGLRLAYQMARDSFRPGAINRLVLCSDGVANVGRTGPESILERVRGAADEGISLTTVGFGMGNFNDVLMEQLADKGDGNYYYVDDLDEARRVFVENLTGTLQTVAREVKVQVAFDPKRVLRYRLLGFENRDVADRDFRNDKIDAGEIGAGHEVTALYEVKLAAGVERGRIAEVRLRWMRPQDETAGEERAIEIAERIDARDLHTRFGSASPHFRLDAAVAELAEILRHSYWAKESRIDDLLPVARDAADELGSDASREFVRLARKAAELSDTVEPPEGERDARPFDGWEWDRRDKGHGPDGTGSDRDGRDGHNRRR